jgi:hypothetical protein
MQAKVGMDKGSRAEDRGGVLRVIRAFVIPLFPNHWRQSFVLWLGPPQMCVGPLSAGASCICR